MTIQELNEARKDEIALWTMKDGTTIGDGQPINMQYAVGRIGYAQSGAKSHLVSSHRGEAHHAICQKEQTGRNGGRGSVRVEVVPGDLNNITCEKCRKTVERLTEMFGKK